MPKAKKYETIKEGKAKLYVSLGKISKKLPVFYNPAKGFDRDLSVLFLRAVGKKKVLDLLAASGARGIRLAKEAGAKVTYNDVSKEAIKILKKNLKLNNLVSKSKVYNMPANSFLAQSHDKFDFIDIDPFGSPILFVFNSIKRLDKDGYLAVTATDTAALFGVYRWTCFRKYGSFSLKTNFSHELGLRILAKAVIELAAKWNVSLTPVFSHATEYYYRIYFKHSRSHVKKVLENIGFVYYCEKCKKRFAAKFKMQEKCGCGNRLLFAGPLYIGNLWDKKLIDKMNLAQMKLRWGTRHTQFLKLLKAEAQINAPYFYETSELKGQEPKLEEFIKELKQKGFKASRTHFSSKGFKTDKEIKIKV